MFFGGRPGIQELIVVLVIALIIFGPRKLPEIGSALGKSLREFKKATSEVKKSISLDEDDEPAEKVETDSKKEAADDKSEGNGAAKDTPEPKDTTEA